ncbi:MAG: glutamate racemase [Candidatus Cloacimonetes bacterium]|nr:glutamate racemase [Candidatus Cloacimonadota bacterium]
MKNPIGIFDSGVGGLTVFREIRKQFPQEDILYFGDTARVPYGPKSPDTIIQYSIQNARFLLQNRAKIIVVACNTASALALPILQSMLPVPVIGVIQPGAKAAVEHSANHKIGIIGTYGTVNSGAYQQEIHKLNPEIEVLAKACPLFVPLVEEGWEDHTVTHQIAAEYLSEFLQADYDTLILGCTHYPILKDTLIKVTAGKIKLIDSAEVIASELESELPEIETSGIGKNLFYVSDNEEKFRSIASRITGTNLEYLNKVFLGESWFIK